MASSSSFVNESSSEYDVFLSFRGETRYNFTSHLYNALKETNIKVFIDKSLEKGEELTPALHKVIDGAKISVVVLSSDYASSSFCLEELANIIECKESKGQTVLPVFYLVDPSNIRKLKQTFEEAFEVHELNFREELEKVERWKSALRKAGHLSGWHVDHKSDEVETIKGIIQQISKKLNWEPTSRSKGQELISTPLVGFTAISIMKKIWLCLIDDKISRVGIYGMGGVGKTAITIHINNQLKKTNSFQHVYWVTVSKESSIYKLQSDIAKEIGLDLSKEEDERKRAAKLWEALNSKKKFLLVLDDMWEFFELEEVVGVPISVDGGKILFTTREHILCQRMKCERIVKIEPLLEREALDLFIRESGHQIDDNPELRNIVESVVKECDGLPLAVKVMARSTRGFVSNYKWRNILQKLQKPSERQNLDMEEKVFKLLKVSYDRLPDDKYRQCLHYCAMYPEDYFIDKNDLIEYCIAGGVINEQDSRQEEIDMGNTIIDGLIYASLLENESKSLAKMHDVVRDMVLAITRGSLLVKARLQLKDLPKFSDWSPNLEGISIMENHEMEGCSFNSAPNCYKLRILLMQNNDKLSELPNCFFVHMQNLTILDMSYLRNLKLLPDSISKLETLRILNLERCSSLEFVPCLAASKDLRYLILSLTNLQNLPEGLEKLVNMKVLRFSYVETLCALNPSEILIELSLLQELDLFGSNVEVDPNALSNLKKLEKLRVEFKNFEALNSYLESRHWQRLESYLIAIKGYEYEFGDAIEDDVFEYAKTLFWYKDMDWDFAPRNMGNSNFIIPFNVECCLLRDWDSPLDGVVINGDFAHLKKLILWKCKLNYLVSVDFAKQLQNIEYLSVDGCAYIEEIIKTEEAFDQNNLQNFPTIKLPKLYELRLKYLPRLKSIYGGNMELPSLQWLMIHECENLVRLPFRKLPVVIEGSNTYSKLWWDSLQWDDQNHKQVFEEFIREEFGDYSTSRTETESGSLIKIINRFSRNLFEKNSVITPLRKQKQNQGV